MSRSLPFPTLPIRRRRRSHWPVILAVLAALGTVLLVAHRVRSRPQQPVEALVEQITPPKVAVVPSAPKKPAASHSSTILASKITAPQPRPVPASVPKLKAMPASEVRGEFEKAASVLRKYFQSPVDEELGKLLRHPAETMPRHREWALTRRIVPANPLQIGPQFGVSGSLLVTGVKLVDGSLRIAALENSDQGYRLDWESFSAWGESRFTDLANLEPGKTALMRVTIKPSSATPPATAPGGASFTIAHPDERSTLAAYATAEVLESTLPARRLSKASGGMFTVRLAVDAEDVKNGLARIHEVIATGWLPDMEEQAIDAKE
ncbi:MAG: hypothetical protein ACKVY0_01965 [Prosthecobacter sp.]|uniref:hypothetical protein n=1 Tax=Prosthecobacter sp. TaxID=1965333 RepID=UPI0038FE906B